MNKKWYTSIIPLSAEGTVSDAALKSEYSGYTFPFETPEEAGLIEQNSLLKTPLVRALEEVGVAEVDVPLSNDDYAEVANRFRDCLEACPEILKSTWHLVDRRFGHDAGFVRKERKIDGRTGKQIQDPKNIFHFNEQARLRWEEQFRIAPAELRSFLEAGYEVHYTLLQVARRAVLSQMEPTHPGITNAIFPAHSPSVSFYRHLDYDDYDFSDYELIPEKVFLPVATRHLDIAWLSMQGHATADGFYGISPDGTKHYYSSVEGQAHVFLGVGHRKLYGPDSFLRPLPHGVDRIQPPDTTHVERRIADVLFLNPWKIDSRIGKKDTKDY